VGEGIDRDDEVIEGETDTDWVTEREAETEGVDGREAERDEVIEPVLDTEGLIVGLTEAGTHVEQAR